MSLLTKRPTIAAHGRSEAALEALRTLIALVWGIVLRPFESRRTTEVDR
jgi:hypothetical protein